MKQIGLLRAHIKHGCLSNIEPEGGTNYNEALHRFINPHLTHAGRIGLPLAYAFLAILFHIHNCKKMKSDTLLDAVSTKLGLYTSHKTAKYGIMPKDCGGNTLLTESDVDTTLLDNIYIPSLPEKKIQYIFKNSMLSTEMIKNLQRIPGSYGTLASRMIPFMSSVPSLFFRGSKVSSSNTKDNHENRLSNVLKTWNMCRQNVAGDGNCCFSAVAYSINANWNTFTDEERDALHSHGLSSSLNIGIPTQKAHCRRMAGKLFLLSIFSGGLCTG